MKLNEIKKKLLKVYLGLTQLSTTVMYSAAKSEMESRALTCKESGVSSDKIFNDGQLIVSLTSFGKRAYHTYLSIESIMRQSVKPNKIILWLPKDMEGWDAPIVLKNQMRRGLEIKYVEDVRSYTKLIPALQQFPDDYIITIDDDIVYQFDLIERLVNSYKRNPNHIQANRVHRLLLTKDKPIPYNEWDWEYDGTDVSPLNFLTGVGGVLYFPHCFDDEVFNKESFLKICKYADDIWFYAMSLKNGVLTKPLLKIRDDYYYENPTARNISALSAQNVEHNLNDKQFKAVFDKYNLWEKLK